MFSTRKGEVRQILHSAFSVLKICTLLGLQYFACSGKESSNLTGLFNSMLEMILYCAIVPQKTLLLRSNL